MSAPPLTKRLGTHSLGAYGLKGLADKLDIWRHVLTLLCDVHHVHPGNLFHVIDYTRMDAAASGDKTNAAFRVCGSDGLYAASRVFRDAVHRAVTTPPMFPISCDKLRTQYISELQSQLRRLNDLCEYWRRHCDVKRQHEITVRMPDGRRVDTYPYREAIGYPMVFLNYYRVIVNTCPLIANLVEQINAGYQHTQSADKRDEYE